jgi:hypothetical protein
VRLRCARNRTTFHRLVATYGQQGGAVALYTVPPDCRLIADRRSRVRLCVAPPPARQPVSLVAKQSHICHANATWAPYAPLTLVVAHQEIEDLCNVLREQWDHLQELSQAIEQGPVGAPSVKHGA